MIPRPPSPTLFPYTTLFRSHSVPCRGSDYPFQQEERVGCDCQIHMIPASIHPDRKSTRLNSSHVSISYAVFCLKKKSLLHVTIHLQELPIDDDRHAVSVLIK